MFGFRNLHSSPSDIRKSQYLSDSTPNTSILIRTPAVIGETWSKYNLRHFSLMDWPFCSLSLSLLLMDGWQIFSGRKRIRTYVHILLKVIEFISDRCRNKIEVLLQCRRYNAIRHLIALYQLIFPFL
jgi:hypothetical protein